MAVVGPQCDLSLTWAFVIGRRWRRWPYANISQTLCGLRSRRPASRGLLARTSRGSFDAWGTQGGELRRSGAPTLAKITTLDIADFRGISGRLTVSFTDA